MNTMQQEINQAVKTLKEGGLILFPFEGSWSIGCDGTNMGSVEKIYQVTGSSSPENLLLVMENPALLERYVQEVPEIAWDLVELSDNPLILIFPNGRNLAPNVYSNENNIRVYFTREAFACQMLQRFRRPLAVAPAVYHSNNITQSIYDMAEDRKKDCDFIAEGTGISTTPVRPFGIIKLWPGGRIEIIRK